MTTNHRRLTEKELYRMINVYASGPLTYIPRIDDPLFELDLIQFYDAAEDNKSVEPKHDSEFFYAKNGSVLPEWYDFKTNSLPPGMACQCCQSFFSHCGGYNGGRANKMSCYHSPHQFREKQWECWTLSAEDITHLAMEKGLSLEGKDLDEIARQVKKGIENALAEWPWDIIIEEAIKNTKPEYLEPSARDYERSELRAMGGGDPNV